MEKAQTCGYALVRHPRLLIAEYEATDFVQENARHLRELRAALSFIQPTAYRGVSRTPLSPFPSTDPEVVAAFADSGGDMQTERAARQRARALIGDDRPFNEDADDDLLDTEEQAREVWGLLEDRAAYEVVCLRRHDYLEPGSILGFDVGYWGGDHFSLIADTAVMPTWHPPDTADYDALAERLGVLNSNVLFATAADALQFKEWYLTKDWAETELQPGQFEVIQVIGIEIDTKK